MDISTLLSFSLIPILASPFLIISFVILFAAIRTKKVRVSSILLACAFSSWAIVFFFIRQYGSWFGGADIGFGIILTFSPALTIPLALIGLWLGHHLSHKKAIFIALIALCSWVSLSLLYNFTLHQKELDFKKISELDCNILPYHCAVRDKKIDLLEQIKSQKDANINARNGWGKTALHQALFNIELTKKLLELGADPNSYDANHYTPLASVIVQEELNLELAELLLAHGADINILFGEDKRMTLLGSSISHKKNEIAKFLLLHGANPKIRDDYGYDACDRIKIYNLDAGQYGLTCPTP